MPFDAHVLQVMIASPGDVSSERTIVREVLAEWNALHARERKTVLLPIGWDTHSAPDLSGRAQQIINDRVLSDADILVGVFWTRIGTPTGDAPSGTVEEIQEHHARGYPTMLYFSDVPVALAGVDHDQYKAVQDFKKWAQENGITEAYSEPAEFRDKFRRHLQITLRDYQLASLPEPEPEAIATPSADAQAIVVAAADGGGVRIRRHLAGTNIQAGTVSFAQERDRRSIARWTAAVLEAERLGLISDVNGKQELFEVTHSGFEFVDGITAAQ